MIRSLKWSEEAARDFDNAVEYIALDSESAAAIVSARILAAVDRLGELPAGRQGRVAKTYEKLVPRTQYIIAYAMTESSITVVRIIHGARDWSGGHWPSE